MKTLLLHICLFLMLTCGNHSYIYSQERAVSIYSLKKAVYSGDASLLPQHKVGDYNYAVVSIPEIQFTNMPSITVWVSPLNPPVTGTGIPGWKASDYNFLRNDTIVITWIRREI